MQLEGGSDEASGGTSSQKLSFSWQQTKNIFQTPTPYALVIDRLHSGVTGCNNRDIVLLMRSLIFNWLINVCQEPGDLSFLTSASRFAWPIWCFPPAPMWLPCPSTCGWIRNKRTDRDWWSRTTSGPTTSSCVTSFLHQSAGISRYEAFGYFKLGMFIVLVIS